MLFFQTLIGGLLQGGIFALTSIGLSLALGVLGIVNFAHGEFLMVAMYLAWFIPEVVPIGPYPTLLISVPLLFLMGVFVVRYLLLPIIDREVMAQLLILIGFSLVVKNLALIIFSADFFTVHNPLPITKVNLGGVIINLARLTASLVSLLVTGGLFWLLARTDLGRQIRAAAQNRRAAALVGVDVKRIYQFAFGIGVGCLGVAGAFMIPVYYVSPDIGTSFILIAFTVVIVGGMGNLLGTLVASFLIGIAESFGAVLMPGSTGPVLPFVLLILTLLFRPEGLLGAGGKAS